MVTYIGKHWRGELSLVRSYWLNLFCVSLVLGIALEFVLPGLEEGFAGASVQTSVAIVLFGIAGTITIWIWQIVGVWRSATRTTRETGKQLWPIVVKALIVIGLVTELPETITVTNDLASLFRATEDPALTAFNVERRGRTDLLFSGAINQRSADEVIDALSDPSIKLLRVNSPGGLVDPAIRIARHVRHNNIVVMAEGECASACVILLAASPSPAVYAGSRVIFHRPEALVEFTNPTFREASQDMNGIANDAFKEFGLPGWAIETAVRQEYWSPTMSELIEMGLVTLVFDPAEKAFRRAEDYCSDYPSVCSGQDAEAGPLFAAPSPSWARPKAD